MRNVTNLLKGVPSAVVRDVAASTPPSQPSPTVVSVGNGFCDDKGLKPSKIRHNDATNTSPPPETADQLFVYSPAADGACFFRAVLAYLHHDSSWLQEQSLVDIYNWINDQSPLFTQAIRDSLSSLQSQAHYAQQTEALLMLLAEGEGMAAFADDFISSLMGEHHFGLWHTGTVQQVLSHYFGQDFAADFTGAFIDSIFQSLAERLGAPLDQHSPVSIQRVGDSDSYHYLLVSQTPMFPEVATVQPEISNRSRLCHCNPNGLRLSGIGPDQEMVDYLYQAAGTDGSSFMRVLFASEDNDASWLQERPLYEVYARLLRSPEALSSAIAQATAALNLDTMFTDGAARAAEVFGHPDFLEAMMNPQGFGLFDVEQILNHAEAHQLDLSACEAQSFVEVLISSLAAQCHPLAKDDNQKIFQLDDSTVIRPLRPGDMSCFCLVSRNPLNGEAHHQAHVVQAQPYSVYPVSKGPDLALFSPGASTDLNTTFYRGWLTLVSGESGYLSASAGALADGLLRSPKFRGGFSRALVKCLFEMTGQRLFPTRAVQITRRVLTRYFGRGHFDLSTILQAMTQARGANGSAGLPRYLLENVSAEQLGAFQQHFMRELAGELGYQIHQRVEIGDEPLTTAEYFVEEPNGGYSFVALGNMHRPFADSQGGRVRDGLFSFKDALVAGVSLLAQWLQNANSSAEYMGFNAHPHAHFQANSTQPASTGRDQCALSERRDQCKASDAPTQIPSVNKDSETQALGKKNNGENPQKNSQGATKPEVKGDPTKKDNREKRPSKDDSSSKPTLWDPLRFPNADAMPVNYKEASDEARKVQQGYDEWHYHRQKRRAGTDADPAHFLTLDIESAYGAEYANEALTKVKEVLATSESDPSVRLNRVAEAINAARVSHGGDSANNRFLQDALDVYMMRMLDTSQEARQAYTFYQQRTKEEVSNGRFYTDTDLERFYSPKPMSGPAAESVPRPSFTDPEYGISAITDYLLAKVLIAQENGVPLNPQQLGLAWGELSVHRQILQANTDLEYTKELRVISHKDRRHKLVESIEERMRQGGHSDAKFVPVETPFAKLMSDGAPVTPKGQGACHYVAIAAALEMQGTRPNTAALVRILDKMKQLEDYSTLDPAKAHRLLSGLSEANDKLQHFVSGQLAHYKSRISSLEALHPKIKALTDPMVLTFRDQGQNPHVMSVSPIRSPSRRDPSKIYTSYLVVDTNLGVVPCATAESAMNVVRLCAQRYLGSGVADSHFTGLSISAMPVNAEVKSTLAFRMVAETPESKVFIPVGPHANVERPIQGNDIFSYKHLFDVNAPTIGELSNTHGSSSSDSWKTLLPYGLGEKAVEGNFNLDSNLRNSDAGDGRGFLTKKTSDLVEKMRMLSTQSDVQCTQGTCSIDLQKYQDSSAVKTGVDEVIYGAVKVDLERTGHRIEVDVESTYSEVRIRAPEVIDDMPPPPPPRHRGPGNTPAVELKKTKKVKKTVEVRPEAPRPPAPPIPSPADDLIEGMKRLKTAADMDIEAPRRPAPPPPSGSRQDNVYRQALDDNYRQQAQGGPLDRPLPRTPDDPPAPPPRRSAENSPPAVPKRGGGDGSPPLPNRRPADDAPPALPRRSAVSDGPPVPVRERQPLAAKKVTAAGGAALEMAAMQDGAMQGNTRSPLERKGAKKLPPRAQHQPAEVDSPPAIPPRVEGDQSGKQQMKKVGAEFLQQQRQRRAAPPPVPDANLERGGADVAKPQPLKPAERHSVSDEVEPVKLMAEVMASEDAATTRAMGLLMEEVKVHSQRSHAVMLDIEDVASAYIKGKKMQPGDWVVLPPKEGDTQFTMLYRGNDETITERVQKMEMPEGYGQRLAEVQANQVRLHAKLEDSPRFKAFTSKMMKVMESKGYARFGSLMGLAGKAMSMYNMYTLMTESQELAQMATQHKVSFAMSATDGVFDAASLLAGSVNKLAKLAGYSVGGLQAASRGLGKVSMGIGVGASVGSTFTHMYGMRTAGSPIEFEIAAANTGFSAASALLTMLMLAFPPAMPVIAIFNLALMGIQYAVIQAIIDQHLTEEAKQDMHQRWQNTEDLLKFVSQIGQSTVEEVSVTQDANGQTTLHINPKAANARIEITGNNVKIIHKSDAFSASFQENTFVPQDASSQWRKHAPLLSIGKADKSTVVVRDTKVRSSVKDNIPCVKEKKLEIYGLNRNFRIGGKGHQWGIAAVWDRVTDELRRGEFRLKQAGVTDELVNCLLLNDEKTFKTKLTKYLETDTSLPKPPDVIVLGQMAPKVELVSDVTRFTEEGRMKSQKTTQPLVNAITNKCQAKATKYSQDKQRACQAAAASSESVNFADVCMSTPSYRWGTKATTYSRPAVSYCDDKSLDNKELMVGKNFIHDKYTLQERKAMGKVEYSDDREGVKKQSVSAIPTSVRLTPSASSIRIDVTKTKDSSSLKLIVLPEKISTGLVTKTLISYPFDYGTKGKKADFRALKVHKDSYKEVKSLATYDLDVVANQDTSMILAAGTKTHVREKDTASGDREGRYFLTLISTNSAETQQRKIAQLKAEKSQAQARLPGAKRLIPIHQKTLEKRQVVYNHALVREDPRSVFDQYLSIDAYKARVKSDYDFARKLVKDAQGLVGGLQNRIKELESLIPIEEELTYVPIKELKTKISYQAGKKKLTLKVNNNEPQEYNKIKFVIDDLQRNVTLIHYEPVTVNGTEVKFGCVFDLNIENDQPKLKLNQVGALSAEDVKKINEGSHLQRLGQQLQQNNPQFDLSSMPNSTISTLTLKTDDRLFVGAVDGGKAAASGQASDTHARSKRSLESPSPEAANDPEAFTGHVMLFNLNGMINNGMSPDGGASESISNAVSVIYPKAASASEVEMYRRLGYLGEESILSRAEVPLEYQTLYDTLESSQRKIYYLYDPEGRHLVKQYMNAAIRTQDISTCDTSELPQKFIGVNGQPNIYQCGAKDAFNLSTLVTECKDKNSGSCEDLFGYLAQKQASEALPAVLTINNPGLSTGSPMKTPLWMEFTGGENPSLMLIEQPTDHKNIGVVERNAELGYALIAEEIATTETGSKAKLDQLNALRKTKGLDPISELRISSTRLLKGAELANAARLLAANDVSTNGIPPSILQKMTNLAPHSHIAGLIRNPEGGFVIETLDGVAFSVSDDLTQMHLVATDQSYLTGHQIDISDPAALTKAFTALEAKYGVAQGAYLKMSEGEAASATQTTKPIIFIDTEKKSPLYIPRSEEISESAYVLGSLERRGIPIALTVVDPESRAIATVAEPMSMNTTQQANTLAYGYFKVNGESMSLSLRSSPKTPQATMATTTSTSSSESKAQTQVALPYIPSSSLYLLPQLEKSGEDHTSLTIGQLMREQLRMITIVPPADVESGKTKEGVVQTVALQSDPTQEVKAFIEEVTYTQASKDASQDADLMMATQAPKVTTETKTLKRLFIAVPKVRMDANKRNSLQFIAQDTDELSKSYTMVQLYDAFDDSGELKGDFADRLVINNKPMTLGGLKELINKATKLPESSEASRKKQAIATA